MNQLTFSECAKRKLDDTYLVLLILAGISIMMLTGENGIIKQATKSKEETIIGQEKEQVEMAYVSAAINKLGENVTSKELQTELNNLVGQNETNVSGGTILKVYFKDTEHEYKVKNGKVTKYEKMEPTAVYAKLYTDGTLILSSYDYTDETKEVSKDYEDVSNLYDYRIDPGDVPRIYGEGPGWFGSNGGYLSTPNNINVIIFDEIAPRNTAGWFYNVHNIENIENLDTSNVTNMAWMFSCCDLSDIDLCFFDTSNVADMSKMFYYCRDLISLDLSSFDTSRVTDMESIFSYSEALATLDLSSFDTSNVTDMSLMFGSCSGLNTIYVSNKWSNESVTSSSAMFSDCTNLKGAISYDSSKKDVTYANYDTGYFTYKEAP